MATIDPPRAIRIKTSTGWADLAIAGTPGYPDTTGKLADVLTVTADGAAPQWKPPAPQGAQITYIGQYDPAHVYHDGDYVVDANGMTYQCVIEGTTGVAPTPWSSGVWVQLPTVVNGQFVKGVGGAAVWAPITQADLPPNLGAAPTLAPGDDLQQIASTGWYYWQPSTSNQPPGNSGYGYVQAYAWPGTFALRLVAYEYNSTKSWTKIGTGAWEGAMIWLGPALVPTGRIAHNTDYIWQWTHGMGKYATVVSVRIEDLWYARNLTTATQEAPNYTNIIFSAIGGEGDGAGEGNARVTLGFKP